MELKALFARTPAAAAGTIKGTAVPVPVERAAPDRLRGRPLVEMFGIFAILCGIDHGMGSGGAFVGIEPHPFWLPVLLMAVTYGSGMGLASALAATIIWIVDHGPLGDGDHLQRMLTLSILPMLWATSALVIGEISSSRLIRLARLAQQRVTLKRDQNKLVDMIRQLTRANRALQVRIAVEDRALEDAVVAAMELVEARADQRIAGTERLVRLVTGTADFVFYRVMDGELVAVLQGRGAHGEMMMADLLGSGELGDNEDAIIRIGPDCHAVPLYADGDAVLHGVFVVEGVSKGPLSQSLRVALVQIARSLDRLVPRLKPQDAPLFPVAHPRVVVQGHAA